MKKKIKARLPLGYKANGLACGIIPPKRDPATGGKKSGKLDLGLIFSQCPAKAVGQFTANKIISGSVKLSQDHLKISKNCQAIIFNSGNANCLAPLDKIIRRGKSRYLTGLSKEDSFKNAEYIADEVARELGIKKKEVLIASTGIIGPALPVERIKKSIPALVKGLSRSGLPKTAEAMLTTDTFTKASLAVLNIGAQKSVTICGLAKGAGMIAPKLGYRKATMLCFLLSDANITQKALRLALKDAVDSSFNCITIDGCMSTNDTVFLMSNSCADNPRIAQGSKEFHEFCSALKCVCLDLAKMIVKDAEGATKFIQIKVKQAKDVKEAKQVALSIANSNLFKTAMFGQNNNPGRIMAAIGASGVNVAGKDLAIEVSPLNKKDIYIEVGIRRGNSQAIVYTSDLSPEYVKINAEYS